MLGYLVEPNTIYDPVTKTYIKTDLAVPGNIANFNDQQFWFKTGLIMKTGDGMFPSIPGPTSIILAVIAFYWFKKMKKRG